MAGKKTPAAGDAALTEEGALSAVAETVTPTATATVTPPTDDASALKSQIAAIEGRLQAGEMRGMSESTAHSLLEQIRDLNTQLVKQGERPVPLIADAPRTSSTGRRWVPSWL